MSPCLEKGVSWGDIGRKGFQIRGRLMVFVIRFSNLEISV